MREVNNRKIKYEKIYHALIICVFFNIEKVIAWLFDEKINEI